MNPLLTLASSLLMLTTQSACATTADVHQVVQSKFQPLVDTGLPKEKRYQSIIVGIVTPF